MPRAAVARVVPVTVLAAIVVIAAVARFQHRTAAPPGRGAASAARDPSADANTQPPPLAGPLPPASAAVSGHSARMLHGDARHTHRARGRGPRSFHVAWTYRAKGPVAAQVVASPDGDTLYVASLDGTLTALGRDDGKPRFSIALGDRVYSTPCVADDGTIYVGSDAKRWFSIDPTGRVLWKLETSSDADTGAVIDTGGRVIFAAGRTVFAVRPRGDVAWRFEAKAKVYTSPAVTADGLVVFGAQDHRAYALTGEGALAWASDLGADVDGSPAIGDDGGIHFGTDAGEVVRLDARGAVEWRTQVGGFVRGALSVTRSGDVLAGVYGPLPRQVRLAGADGHLVGAWSIQGTGAKEFGVHGGALEDDDGTVFFGAQDDAVYAIRRDGARVFRFETGGDVDAPVTLLGDGSLIVASDDGAVYRLAP